MSRWRTFVDVLDEILTDQEPVVATHASTGYRPATRVATTPVYAYTPHLTPNQFWAAPGPYRPAPVPDASRHSPGTEIPPPSAKSFKEAASRTAQEKQAHAEPRAARPLKPVEETALQTLVRLGAALDKQFTSRELRSTFRALAQRYHPDRHPNVSDAERRRLGATFAELTQAYGVLHNATH